MVVVPVTAALVLRSRVNPLLLWGVGGILGGLGLLRRRPSLPRSKIDRDAGPQDQGVLQRCGGLRGRDPGAGIDYILQIGL
jgi:hypothetical protein